MKSFLIILISLIPIFTYSQDNKINIPIPFDQTNNDYRYSEVVNLPDQNVKDISRNTYSWAINKYGPSQFLDSLNNTVFQKGSFSVNPSIRISGVDIAYDYKVNFDITIAAKDNHYKYQFSNIQLSNSSEGTGPDISLSAYIKNGENLSRLSGKKFIALTNETLILIDTQFKELITQMKLQIIVSKINEW